MASIQEVQQHHAIVKSYDEIVDCLRIGGGTQSVRIDEVSSSLQYFGFALVGSLGSAAVWKISRLSVSGTVTSIENADGNMNYDNIWDNRASLAYT